MRDQYFCLKVLRKQNGPKTNKFVEKLPKKGKTVVSCAFLRSKYPNLAQSLKNFARPCGRMVAAFRNSEAKYLECFLYEINVIILWIHI